MEATWLPKKEVANVHYKEYQKGDYPEAQGNRPIDLTTKKAVLEVGSALQTIGKWMMVHAELGSYTLCYYQKTNGHQTSFICWHPKLLSDSGLDISSLN